MHRLKVLQERLDETEHQLEATNKQKEELVKKLGEMQGVHDALKTEVAESKTSQAELLNRVNKLLERLDDKDDILSNVNEEKHDLVNKLTKVEASNSHLESEVQSLKQMYGVSTYFILFSMRIFSNDFLTMFPFLYNRIWKNSTMLSPPNWKRARMVWLLGWRRRPSLKR